MGGWDGFIVGFFVGAIFGIFIMALMAACKHDDEPYEPPDWADKYMGPLPKIKDDEDDE